MAALSGGEICIKYLMFAFNLVFWLTGTAVFAIGLWLKVDPQTKNLFEGPDSSYVFYTGAYILIGAGALMMVVGFLGCCGAIQESPWMLGLFFFFLLIIFTVEVAAGIWGFSNQNKVVEDFSNFYIQTYNEYEKTGDENLKKTLQLIQTQVNHLFIYTFFKFLVPFIFNSQPIENKHNVAFLFQSCPEAIDKVFDSKLLIIGGVGITVGVVMIFGMIFSMLLCCAIRKSREVV
uniref:Tetraspanin n=1 Tax=Kryptolebias marmoratus TaxID=37003 RepID=A0A3Q3AU87_KRYMA